MERHRAATPPKHPHQPELSVTVTAFTNEFDLSYKNFAAAVDLWPNHAFRTSDAEITYANYIFQSELHSTIPLSQLAAEGFNKRTHLIMSSSTDKDFAAALFSIGDFGNFKASLNLKLVKAKPDDPIPTQIKPGFGGSLDF